MTIAAAICHHLMDSGFSVNPPGHSFGPLCGEGELGAARLYMGSASDWLGTNRNSEYLADIKFRASGLQVMFHTDGYGCYKCGASGWINDRICDRCGGQGRSGWQPIYIAYVHPDMFAMLYNVLRARAETHHKE